MTERVPCKDPSCGRTILPATAEKTDGYCMVCVREKAEAGRREHIAKNRRDYDPYAGLSDPVAILEVMFTDRVPDPLLNVLPYRQSAERTFQDLAASDWIRLQERIVVLWKENSGAARALTSAAAAFSPLSIDRLLSYLIERRIFYPPFIFARASDGIRRGLVNAGDILSSVERGHWLEAMAWAGGEEIIEDFRKWKNGAWPWRSTITGPLERYSHQAAWEFDANSEVRPLHASVCYELQPYSTANSATSVVSVGLLVDQDCPWCKRPLLALLAMDMTSPELRGLSFGFSRLLVVTCPACSCYGHVFTRVTPDGGFEWYDTEKPEFFDSTTAWDPFPQNALCLGQPRLPLHAVDQFLPTSFSQVGGFPCWIQDADFPRCPICSLSMPFLAQVDMGDIEEYGEGMYYAFFCEDCGMAATTYQQT